MQRPLRLRATFGPTPEVKALWDGTVSSERIELDLVKVEPIYKAFRPMVRSLAFDLSEMSVVTYAQAKLAGHGLVALPIPVARRFHHGSALCLEDGPISDVGDLAGRRVAVRSWPQTSGVWARGILAQEYGLALDQVRWIIQEDAHIAGYREPLYVTMEASDRALVDMLPSGEVDAIMGIHGIPEGLRSVISNPEDAAKAWYERTGIFPVNHVVALKSDLVAEHPWLIAEVTRMVDAAREWALRQALIKPPLPGLAPEAVFTSGLAANRASIQMLLDFAHEQQLIERNVMAEEIFDLE